MSESRPLMQLRRVKKYFSIRRKVRLRALRDINFTLYEGEKFGVVGESGCGKSTLGKVMLQLYPPSGGDCLYYGHSLAAFCPGYLKKEIRRLLQLQKKAKIYAENAAKAKDNEARNLAMKLNHRYLREGSKTVGSLILCQNLSHIVGLFTEAHKETTCAHRLLNIAMKLEAKAEKWERSCRGAASSWREAAAAKREIAQKHEDNAEGLRKEAFAYRGKNFDPSVSKRAPEKEYQDKLDSNFETGISLSKLTGSELKSLRREMQMVFQDPSASLDPRQAVGKAIEEVFKIHTNLSADERREKVMALLERVGLKREHYNYYPHALSGGQKQRVCIARAIATDTRLVVLDESLSALDVSVQAQILSLLEELSGDGRTYLFITHDLGVAKYFCHRIMVMYLGCECEMASSEELFVNPLHPYTQSLLAAIPRPVVREVDYDAPVLEGEVPNALHPPSGCFFHTRCNRVMDICKKEQPVLWELKKDHFAACHLYDAGEKNSDSEASNEL